MSRPDPRRVARRVVISLVVFGFLVLAVEMRLRASGLPRLSLFEMITELDRDMLFRNRPNLVLTTPDRGQRITTNGAGFRHGEITVRKPAGVVRIFALGDSVTFGHGVSDEETFASRLGEMLRTGSGKRRPAVEVINAGVIGHTSLQGVRLLELKVLPYGPDVVIAGYALNDSLRFERHWDGWGSRTIAEIGRVPGWIVWTRNVMFNRVSLFRWALKGYYEARSRIWYAGNPGFDWSQVRKAVPPESYVRNLERFAELGQEHGFMVVYLVAPVNLKFSKVPSYARPDVPGADGTLAMIGKAKRDLAAEEGWQERSAIRYYLAQAYESLGRRSQARTEYEKAIFELNEQFDPRKSAIEYGRLLRDAGRRLGVPVVDAQAVFSARETAGDTPGLFSDIYHPGPTGHRLIARELARALRSAGALDRRRSGGG